MTGFVRTVVRDLVDRRLWPVAVALLVALVAVPVVVARGGADAPAGEPLAAAPAQDPTPAVSLAEPRSSRSRPGAGRNPFRRGKAAAAAAPAETTNVAKAPAPAAAGSGGATGGTSTSTPTPQPSAPAVSTPKATTPQKSTGGVDGATTPEKSTGGVDAARTVTLRFGAAGAVKTRKGLGRLTPLPSSESPLLVFTGVLKDGRTARFLISTEVTATGDGVCRPSPANCQSIDLRAGDTEVFDFTDAEARPQYRLDLLSVGGRAAKTASDIVRDARTSPSAARASYSTSVRFGAAGAVRAKGLPRLQPLGDPAGVAFQYLGVGSDRRSGIFVLGPRARLLSRNACLDGVACRAIALRRQDTAAVSVDTGAGPRRYDLRLMTVRRTIASTPAGAARARTRVSESGRGFLRSMIRDRDTARALGALRFSPRTGVVSRRAPAPRP